MKKALGLIFSLLLTLSLMVSAGAEEFNGADLFTIDLPEGFEQTGASVSDFSFKNEDGDTLAITYAENTAEGEIFSPADMSQKEIDAHTQGLVAEAEVAMKELADSFKMEVVSGEKIKHANGKTAIVCRFKTDISFGEEDVVYYQTMYEFGGIDYKYTFTYTTTDEDKSGVLDEAFEGIEIFEAETRSGMDKLASIAGGAVVVVLVIIGIVKFIMPTPKNNKGKRK